MKLVILYRNGQSDVFEEKDIDCSKLTIRGHASKLIDAGVLGDKPYYVLDSYNAVVFGEILSIRVI